MTLRSVRNNNPGNIDRGHFNWQGQMPADKMTPEQKIEPRFVVFQTPGWGFRAMCVELHTYWQHDGCRTIEAIISRWAPPGENDTTAYIADVALKSGIDAHVVLNLDDADQLIAIARAIASHEAGGPLPYAQSFYPYWSDSDLVWGAHAALAGVTI
jgi:hypothetical protein